ncbi:hypothetical protein D3C85_1536730 [compost metagenome]
MSRAPNSGAVVPRGSMPLSASILAPAGDLTMVAISADSRCTSGAGVLAGASMPIQPIDSKPVKPASVKVGTFGMDGTRAGPSVASTLIRPASP